MKYVIYSDLEMKKVRKVVETTNAEVTRAVYAELRLAGVDCDTLTLPFKLKTVGIEIISL